MNKRLVDLCQLKLVVGLGNPGPRYATTRHNVGFMLADQLLERSLVLQDWREGKEGLRAEVEVDCCGKQTILTLLKPQTGMNVVAGSVRQFLKQGVGAKQVLVLHDELERPFGSSMVRLGGSARGHNGLRSLIELFGQEFWRLRFGIGRPERKEMVSSYVLQPFSGDECEKLTDEMVRAIDLIMPASHP